MKRLGDSEPTHGTRKEGTSQGVLRQLGERKDLTCYVRRRWIPFGKRAISQILGLGQVGECTVYEQLQKSPSFEEISRDLTNGLGQWQRTKAI